MGTLPASMRMICGGSTPGGMLAWARLAWATTSAIACAMSVPG